MYPSHAYTGVTVSDSSTRDSWKRHGPWFHDPKPRPYFGELKYLEVSSSPLSVFRFKSLTIYRLPFPFCKSFPDDRFFQEFPSFSTVSG